MGGVGVIMQGHGGMWGIEDRSRFEWIYVNQCLYVYVGFWGFLWLCS